VALPPLDVQFFDLYVLSNEQGKTVQQVWDGSTLKLTFVMNNTNMGSMIICPLPNVG
jgi:hypothetical protein